MLELQEHTGKLKAENYGLWEFLQDLQQGVNQGYELDDSNEGFPQVFGSLYTCLLKVKTNGVDLLKKELRILPGGGLAEVVKVDAPDNGLMKYVPDNTKNLVSPVGQEITPLNKQRKQKG